MSSEPSKVTTKGARSRPAGGARRRAARGAGYRRPAVEGLEARELLAVLPPSTTLAATVPVSVTSGSGNMSTPSVAIDQNNPNKLVSVWTRNDPNLAPGPTEIVQFAVSNDGGKSWTQEGAPGGLGGTALDPTTSNPVVPFPLYSDASVGFDRSDNFYILYMGHHADNSAGVLLLSKYSFATGTPTTQFTNKEVYKWTQDPAFDPTLVVDDSVPTFTDTDVNGVTRSQTDPYSGNVYVAWTSADVPPAFLTNLTNYDPNRVQVVASSDGGNTFSGIDSANDNGNFGQNRPSTPRLAVSQGSPSRGVAPGQLSVVWDDWGIGSKANPPFDQLTDDRISNGAVAATFSSAGGPIADAGAGTPNSPSTTDFPITVNVTDPRFTSVTDVTVNLGILHPQLGELQIVLIPPAGSGLQQITLVQNQTDAAGNTNGGIGVNGANLGIAASGEAIGTTFDDNATRDIVDPNTTGGRGASAPFVGHFRPETGSLNALYDGATAGAANSNGSINGTWTLRITDFRNGNVGSLVRASITFNSGFTPNVDRTVADSFVRSKSSGAQVATPADAQGIGATPVIASDNTLGAYSPYEGRLYVAYVDRNRLTNNPADNTDIFLAYSDDGGVNWTRSLTPITDDIATLDGYSEGSSNLIGGGNTGRAQFQPSITVDNATGTLVMSWLDTRDDAARARTTYYLTTSIDGGQTFSKDIYANDSQTATDAISGKTIALAPIPDNQSGGNAEPVAGFGSHQGLAAFGGHAIPVWASNLNGGPGTTPLPLAIRDNVLTYAAGPRVLSTTMGPVGEPSDTLNTARAADGTPVVSAFVVTFDRPIDPSSFTPSDARVYYHDTTANNITGGAVPVNSVVPLNTNALGTATQFQVNFAPRSGVGTYSLQITAADIRDAIRGVKSVVSPVGGASNFASTDTPITVGPNATVTSTVAVNSFPLTQVVAGVTVTVNATTADASSLTFTLISPSGTRITLASHEPFAGAGGQDYANTTFSDNAAQPIGQGNAPFTGTFRPVQALSQLIGQPLNGNWRLQVNSSLTPLTGTFTSWSLSLQAGTVTTVQTPGNKLDQNANAIPGQPADAYTAPAPTSGGPPTFPTGAGPFSYSFNPTTLPLIVPGPHVKSTSIPGQPATSDNLVLDATVNAIDVTFDRDMNPATVTAASVLRIMGPAGPITGPFTVTPNPSGSDPDPTHPRTYRIGFPAQKLSGTYTVTLASTITDARGNALDTNLNAGVDLLRGAVSGPTTPVTYGSTTPVTIPDGKSVTSTINVPDTYPVQGVTVQLDITHPSDPDLQINLVAPDGTNVTLVPFGTGTTGNKANFSQTIFDDTATTLISDGGPPFFGRYKPNQPLSALNALSTVQGTWKLLITDNPATSNGVGGRLNSWSITFQKGTPGTGLGEPVADQATASFRIFNTAPTNPLASTTWTSVGPASMVGANNQQPNNGYAGRMTAVAVDPSDPSGNTVYAAGASGGVWKTTNFLTTSPNGPTWIPLTDFGPQAGLNVSSLAVFPRNNDPRQSIIIAGTGGNKTYDFGGTSMQGVGFLRSLDGGATWQLLDSTNNNLPFAARDHIFSQVGSSGEGTMVEKVVVDPHPTPSGGVIIYAALNSQPLAAGVAPGGASGLWRSDDTGLTWQKLSSAALGDATDVVLDYGSATVDAVSNPTGNVNTIYAAFPGSGVYVSANRGQVLTQMVGGTVDPLTYDVTNGNIRAVPVNNGNNAPVGIPNGKIVLGKPALLPSSSPLADVENPIYEGWLYAAVSDPNGGLTGLFLTKDFGQTWTQLKLSTLPDNGRVPRRIVPTNDPTQPDYNVDASLVYAHGFDTGYIAVDPNNPNIVYLGGTANGNDSGFLRVDATRVYDSHAVVAYDGSRPDGGQLQINTTGRTAVVNNTFTPSEFIGTSGTVATNPGPYINLLVDPSNPFKTDATLDTFNVQNFTNDGSGVRYTPIDTMLQANAGSFVPSSNIHQILTMVDPLTGQSRLIVADDEGVFTGVLNADGTLNTGIGNAPSATYSRNGNLAVGQFYYGSAQPSALQAQVAQALLYGSGKNLGLTSSDPKILSNGNTVWTGITDGARLGFNGVTSGDQASTGVGVGVDPQGNNYVYQFIWPDQGYGGNKTDFFQVSINGGPFNSRTTGLVQGANDTRWSVGNLNFPNGLPMGNFAVNPLDGRQVMISANDGEIYSTINAGVSWLSIGPPGTLDDSYAPALAFGAPDPNAPTGVGNLNNFLYAGTVNGNIFISTVGGGTFNGQNAWTKVSTGLDGSPVVKIITDPTRGSHDAYAVTQKGVYYISDSTAAGASWTNITGNLFNLTISPFGNAQAAEPAISYLTSIQADWRYVIPNDPTNPAAGTHPLLYVSGDAGVYRSLDNGTTWTPFPNQAFDNAPADGGYLPNVHVSDLTIADGLIDPTTGRAVAQPGDPNNLVASTFGRGSFTIRLAPIVFPTSVALDPNLPAPSGSNSGGTDAQGLPIVTIAQPVFDGLSEQTAFGNTVRITLLDLTNPNNPVVIGGYDPTKAVNGVNPTDIPANWTDSAGHFQVQVNPTGFTSNGVKTIGVQATDSSGTVGNIATFQIDLNAKLVSTTAPTTPTLGLNAADDSSGGLGITNVRSPHLVGTTDPGVQVQLYLKSVNGVAQSTLVGTTTADALGNFSFPLSNLADGTYKYQAVATNLTNNLSSTSALYQFQVKTSGPTVVPTLTLSTADDTGVAGDNITTVRMPHFVGVTDPNAKVSIQKATVINGQTVLVPPVLATATADSTGHFSIQLPFALNNGTIMVAVSVADAAGNKGPNSKALTVTIVTAPADFTGAGKTTPALFRRQSNGSALWLLQGVQPASGTPFGGSAYDVPFTGDFDGDGKADLALYRPSSNTWYVRRSTLGLETFTVGDPGTLPAVGDFDGDGVTDAAAYNPTTGQWVIAESTAGIQRITMSGNGFTPQSGDVPVPGNYYGGNGPDLPAVYRPTTGQFFFRVPGGTIVNTVVPGWKPGDVPVPGNYDDAKGYRKTEPAVYDPSTGTYTILGPGGVHSATFSPGDIPAPGDYEGVGRTEPAVFHVTANGTGTFLVNSPATSTIAYGLAGDIPVTAPLAYRNLPGAAPTLALAPASDTGIAGDNITSSRRPFFTGHTDPNVLVDLIDASNRVLGTGAADANGNFTIQLSPTADLPNGTYAIRARAHGLVSNQGPTSAPVTVQLMTVAGDYFGTGAAQAAIFRRPSPNVIQWFVANNPQLNGRPFGAGSLDVPIAADVDGDGKTDLVVYRPSTGQWFAQESSKGYVGQLLANPVVTPASGDIPAPGDYFGTGTAVPAVFRPSTGEFFVSGQSGSTMVVPGRAGDIPVPANYDNTGKDEFAVYRPGTGQWEILGPNGQTRSIFFGGGTGDVPVPGAYDATVTNHAAEPAVFKPGSGQYYIYTPGGGTRVVQFAPGDIPAPGDYEGKGVTEPAVFRPSTGQFLVASPGQTTPHVLIAIGGPIDTPILAPYQYRVPTGGGITLSSVSQGGTIHASSLDLGSTARAFSTGTTAASSAAPTTPAPAGAVTAPVINLSSRVRPRQLVLSRHAAASPLKLNAHVAARKGFRLPG